MREGIDRVSQHQAAHELRALDVVIQSSKETALAGTGTFEMWQRVERVAKYIDQYLEAVDPMVVPLQQLDNMVPQLQGVRSQVDAFTQSQNITHLATANTHLDQVLMHLANIPLLSPSAAASEMVSSVATLRRSVDEMMRAFEGRLRAVADDREALAARYEELSTAVATEKGRIDSFAAQFQQQFSAAQESRQADFSSAESKRAEDHKTAQAKFQESAGNAQGEAVETFAKALSNAEEAHEKLKEALKETANDLISQLQAFKGQAERVVGIISATGMVHGFQKTANDERSAGRLWKFIAAASMIIWISVGLYFFWLTYDKDLTWTAVVRQLLISTPFVLLAGFSALQVSKHHRAERSNRQAELEIASLDPYLASMDDATRNEVKKAMVEKFFGQRDVESAQESKHVVDLMTELVKATQQMQQQLSKKS